MGKNLVLRMVVSKDMMMVILRDFLMVPKKDVS
jgi:hypothetical protein